MNEIHMCATFRQQTREGLWRDAGTFRERDLERISVCRDCGRERPSRFPKILAVEREARVPVTLLSDSSLRRAARLIDSRSGGRTSLHARSLLKRLGGVRAESILERLAASGTIRLVYRPQSGSLFLQAIHILDRNALAEIGHPGMATKRTAALARAREQIANLTHPEAVAIRELFTADQLQTADERIIRALAGLARLVESGEALPWRAFSVRVFEDSKMLSRIRNQIERFVGPIDRLGVRDSGALVVMGGHGYVSLQQGEIDLKSFKYVGLAAEDMIGIRGIEFPESGVLLIENLTPFHACLEQLSKLPPVLVIWSGGFPNRGILRILKEATARGTRIRVWCDIDLSGIRIVRLVHRITSGAAEPILMGPETVSGAPFGSQISMLSKTRILRDIEMHPDALLVDTLRAVIDRGQWVEQEALLDEFRVLTQSSDFTR